jgi:hypothetical protein
MYNSKLLNSRDDICTFLNIGKAVFYQLVDLGLPVKKIGRAWRGHRDVLEKWFKDYIENQESGSSGQGDLGSDMSD